MTKFCLLREMSLLPKPQQAQTNNWHSEKGKSFLRLQAGLALAG